MILTPKQYEVLLYIRNRELGVPNDSFCPYGQALFLRDAGYIEGGQFLFGGYYDHKSLKWTVVTFLGYVVMAVYEEKNVGKEKAGSEADRQ